MEKTKNITVKLSDLMSERNKQAYDYSLTLNNLEIDRSEKLKQMGIETVIINKNDDKHMIRYYKTLIKKNELLEEYCINK